MLYFVIFGNMAACQQINCRFGDKKLIYGLKNCQYGTFYESGSLQKIAKMSSDVFYTVSLEQLRRHVPSGDYIGVGDDFCIMDLRYDKYLDILEHPCRFDCFLVFFCISGSLKMMINLREFDVSADSLFVNLPGNMIKIASIDDSRKDSLHFIVMAMSRKYMSGLKMDMDKVVEKARLLLGDPSFVLDEEEKSVAALHLELARKIMHSGLVYKRESIGSLVSSVFYLAGGMMEKRIMDRREGNKCGDRGKEVFEEFISLVSEYHMSERSVAFYAGKLCVSRKYLSRLVMSASGRPASDWIDDYVILEAKNMLKYSRLQIKEIVERLNFPDPPTFQKFFRRHTGMTPGKYRRGR